MLDSDQEPSYNLSKNLLLLPRILKLIEDMVDDSTPLLKRENEFLQGALLLSVRDKRSKAIRSAIAGITVWLLSQ